MTKQMKDELESLGQAAGKRIAERVSKGAEDRGEELGGKVGRALGEQLGRMREAIDEESVTPEEELGVGGKIGTGLGIIGKRLAEKRYGFLAKFMAGDELVSQGRTLGAKAEKLMKKAVKKGMENLADQKAGKKEPHKKQE